MVRLQFIIILLLLCNTKRGWMQCHSRVSRTEERSEASRPCHPGHRQQRLQLLQTFIYVCLACLGLLGTLGQHGRGGSSQDRYKIYVYIHTRTCTQLLTELVLLRFQQSGLSRFCSSARALASMVYILLSSFFIFFHLSPRMTLMALEQVNSAEIKIQKVPYFEKKQKTMFYI